MFASPVPTHTVFGADGATGLEPLELPETVQALVRTRLRQISADRRQVLETAALVGQRIDIDLLVGVIGDQALVLAALDDATAAGLLVERAGTLAFRHDLVRTTLAASGGPALRTAGARRSARCRPRGNARPPAARTRAPLPHRGR